MLYLFLFSPHQCLKQYVELLIKEGLETAISCPDSACPKRGHLQENEVRGGEKKKHSLRSLSFSLAKFAFWLLTGCQSPKHRLVNTSNFSIYYVR